MEMAMAMVTVSAMVTVLADGNDNGAAPRRCPPGMPSSNALWQCPLATATVMTMAMADGNSNGNGNGHGSGNGDGYDNGRQQG
jgi:hypothetical protein